jgi:hypothetical protein
MIVSDAAARQAVAYGLRTPASGRRIPRCHRSDFGGPDSYRLKVRRIGKNYDAPASIGADEPCFGLYLGPHDGKWIVALQTARSLTIVVGLAAYPSLNELKQHWELD